MRKLLITALAIAAFATGAVAQTADVQVIHNSPDPGAVMVDIYLDGGAAPAIPDFDFRAATAVLALPAGVETVIGVAPGNSSGPSTSSPSSP